jgi:hypothetical protein
MASAQNAEKLTKKCTAAAHVELLSSLSYLCEIWSIGTGANKRTRLHSANK